MFAARPPSGARDEILPFDVIAPRYTCRCRDRRFAHQVSLNEMVKLST